MANDSTVKAGSWGARTVEKIVRIQETALKLEIPMLYLVDSAGARITDQVDMFPNRREQVVYSIIKLKCLDVFHKYVYCLAHQLQEGLIFLHFVILWLWLKAMLLCI